MTVQVIKCESEKEAVEKAEAFKNLIEGQQIIVVDEYVCVGKPGEWVECTQNWDANTNKYVTTISTDQEEVKKTEDSMEDLNSKTKIK